MRNDSLALSNEKLVQQLAESLEEATGLSIRRRSLLERTVKRSIDVVVSLLVLIFGFPFFLAIALLIKITSKGPVFFRQRRVGRDGSTFILFKFRTMKLGLDDTAHREFTKSFINGHSMHTPLDHNGDSVYKLTGDPRVTGIGSFLRRVSLDELPQFINIIKGEMTVVGPRPSLPYEYDCFKDWHKLRVKVKPGLTGLWQVSGRSTVTFDEMVKLDLYYIESWALLMDIKIMFKTLPVMLAGTGGY
ncbi:MAG: sugar transferase [Candidatus Krumholzibacteria bacterium]|nr:sugar transferase [Candidatus Krumholzibacteria bacterium]